MAAPRKPALLLLLVMGIILLVLEAVIVWRPFNFHAISYGVESHNNKVAGEIVKNFRLTQTVPAGLFKVSHKRKMSIHWHNPNSLGHWTEPNCFSIRFASYSRRNSGSLLVDWKQGSMSQRWRFNAASLRNAYRDFCPNHGLDTTRAFQISIRGIDSVKGHAATVWLTKSNPIAATVNGKSIGGRGVLLHLTYLRHVGPRVIAALDNGAFVFACLCSLGLGLLALIAIKRIRPAKPEKP